MEVNQKITKETLMLKDEKRKGFNVILQHTSFLSTTTLNTQTLTVNYLLKNN